MPTQTSKISRNQIFALCLSSVTVDTTYKLVFSVWQSCSIWRQAESISFFDIENYNRHWETLAGVKIQTTEDFPTFTITTCIWRKYKIINITHTYIHTYIHFFLPILPKQIFKFLCWYWFCSFPIECWNNILKWYWNAPLCIWQKHVKLGRTIFLEEVS